MANLEIRDGDNTEKYLKGTGAGSDGDPFIPQHLETNSAAIKTAIEIIDNAIAGNEMQVDVVTLPAIVGSVTANAGTNLNTSALALETTATSIKIAAEIMDDWDESDRAKVNLIVGQAGVQGGSGAVSNITQRVVLATDVALPAGENLIGLVTSSDTVVDLTATLDTSIYAGGDLLFDTQELAGVARINAGVVVLESITVIDEDDQGVAFDIYFLDANNTLGTENSAPTISDANARNILGWILIGAADYKDLGGVRIACVRGIGLEMKAGAGTTSLYVAGVTGGTPTHTASGLRFKFGFLR